MASRRMWITATGAGVLTFAAVQLIRPAISHLPVTADLAAPPEIKQILRNSCYDCHSNETRLAWFDELVPVYWLVAHDVQSGRRKLNFSEIGRLPATQQKAALYEAVNQIQFAAMPLPAYTRLHRAALISAAQLSLLKSFLSPTTAAAMATPAVLASDDAEYQKWLHADNSNRAVEAALNGVQFPHDYKNWKAISSTDRFDNQTVRVILGNDTAAKAVADGHTNPWPDGTMFAKVAWVARDDGHGQIRPGAFGQVEFMIRSAKKYAATKGWGWARWRGAGLTPYGKDADFATECIGCHAPLRDRDYVFTEPLGVKQLPPNSLQWNAITSLIDKRASTMSTLYGNDVAVRYARNTAQHDYLPGSELLLVTWEQREDMHWFGGNIPGRVNAVERVHAAARPDRRPSYSYERYEGSPLIRVSVSEGRSEGRAAFLLSLRAAVMP
jgi:hypothetical protein